MFDSLLVSGHWRRTGFWPILHDASGHFWQVQPNLAAAKFLAVFSVLAGFVGFHHGCSTPGIFSAKNTRLCAYVKGGH